ncbi:hypothetical protein Tco_0034383 [Tanacetum coccineum]
MVIAVLLSRPAAVETGVMAGVGRTVGEAWVAWESGGVSGGVDVRWAGRCGVDGCDDGRGLIRWRGGVDSGDKVENDEGMMMTSVVMQWWAAEIWPENVTSPENNQREECVFRVRVI